jgi:ABC-type transporter MlaC component
MPIENWEARAKWYETACKGIRLMEDLSLQDVRKIEASIDSIINEAFFDVNVAKADYERVSATVKTLEAEYFLAAKDDVQAKMSDEKAKQFARQQIGDKVDEKVEAEIVLSFLENVIKLMQEKHDLLTISYATLKMEMNFAG